MFIYRGAQHAQNSGYVISCSINLSEQSLNSDGFIEFVTESNVQPDLIVFEITETAAKTNIDSILNIISELKKSDVKLPSRTLAEA